MKRSMIAVLGVVAVMVAAGAAQAVVIDTVPVGNPGNADDTHGDGYGGVAYDYNIGTYEVTVGQYTEFLKAVAKTDTYGLYNGNMASYGIGQSGVSGSFAYTVSTGWDNRPVSYVCWYDAIRFANWMTSGSTESGSYTITGGVVNGGTVAIPDAAQRATWAGGTTAYWMLTSEDEWYKAAYYDPDKAGGAGYWDYPNGSDTAPTATIVANQLTVAPGSANYSGAVGSTTVVGSYDKWPTDSIYGTFDQAGNVWEWTEAISVSGSSRIVRGGEFYFGFLDAAFRFSFTPLAEVDAIGFRVSEVPEPATLSLLALGGVLTFLGRRRRK